MFYLNNDEKHEHCTTTERYNLFYMKKWDKLLEEETRKKRNRRRDFDSMRKKKKNI